MIETVVTQTLPQLNDDERASYLRGVVHAYGAVFEAFTAVSGGPGPHDISAVLDRVTKQWEHVSATHIPDFVAEAVLP